MWQRILVMTLTLACAGIRANAGQPENGHDPTIAMALRMTGLPRAEWPPVVLVEQGQFRDPAKDLESFAAFRIRRGRVLDPAVYVNPRHRFYLEARGCGADLYPLLRLASLIRHELQHGQAEHGEAAALHAQAAFLRRSMLLLSRRRQEALAYVQALEATLPIARRWDAEGRYPAVAID
jgi:hypothetical protein